MERRTASRPRKRQHLLLIVAVAVVSLADGSTGSGAPGSSAGTRPFDAAAISELVAIHNPHLSMDEQRRIGQAVMRSSERHGLDPMLVTAVLLRESNARPWARSPKGALGLMQVMPHMLEPLGLAGNANTIESNVEAGCLILAENIQRLGEEDGISAYFWGSEIRGVAYLRRVQATLAELRAAHSAS
jgi:hypothetical protein